MPNYEYINWRAVLLNDFIGSTDIVKSNISKFKDKSVGMVCNGPLMLEELEGTNVENIKQLCSLLGIEYESVKNGTFPAGSMFMSRTDLFQTIFNNKFVKKITTKLKNEYGKVNDWTSGKYSHAIERIFGYTINNKKLKIQYTQYPGIQIKNDLATNGYLKLIRMYNNECYILEDIHTYGKILENNTQIAIQWYNLPTKPQIYSYITNDTIINTTSSLDNLKDFDEKFYISEYPDVITYDQYSKTSVRQRMLDHYVKYGKNEGRSKNSSHLSNILIDRSNDIIKNIKNKDILCPSNNLECICLLTTSKEIQKKTYDKFIRHLCSMTRLSKHAKKLHFKIILNNDKNIPKITNLKKIFKTVEIINLDLSPDEDIYLSGLPHNKTMPVHGLKSGPNLCFFKAIKHCANYSTTLLLETDCLLGVDWIEKIMNYTRYANGFLISGAVYDGESDYKSNSVMSTHINGGTGIYATGNKILQSLIKTLEELMKEEVSKDMIGLAYDYALKAMIDNNNDRKEVSPQIKKIWRFIKRNYLPNKLIINCSTINDDQLNKTYLKKIHNYAILHKK